MCFCPRVAVPPVPQERHKQGACASCLGPSVATGETKARLTLLTLLPPSLCPAAASPEPDPPGQPVAGLRFALNTPMRCTELSLESSAVRVRPEAQPICWEDWTFQATGGNRTRSSAQWHPEAWLREPPRCRHRGSLTSAGPGTRSCSKVVATWEQAVS